MDDAIHDRVAHVDVGMRHVDLGAQDARAIGELAVLHALEQVQVLFHVAVAVGGILAGFGERAAVGAHLLRALIVHIGLALLDQLLSPIRTAGRSNRRRR